MSDRVKLAREIAARSKPRFTLGPAFESFTSRHRAVRGSMPHSGEFLQQFNGPESNSRPYPVIETLKGLHGSIIRVLDVR